MGAHGRPTKWDKWYSTARWARILSAPSSHRRPSAITSSQHHGDVSKFWLGPFQSLCKRCHASTERFGGGAVLVPLLAWMGGLWTRSGGDYLQRAVEAEPTRV